MMHAGTHANNDTHRNILVRMNLQNLHTDENPTNLMTEIVVTVTMTTSQSTTSQHSYKTPSRYAILTELT